MRYSVNPVGPGAAEIIGLDCSQAFSDELFHSVEESFREYPVLVFRNQNLSASELAAFGRRFGPLDHYSIPSVNKPQLPPPQPSGKQKNLHQMVYLSPDDRNVLVMTNESLPDSDLIGIIDDAETWHSDASYKPDPYKAIMLHVVSNPASGGETEFCDLQALFDFLPASLQAILCRNQAVHHWSKCRNPRFAATLEPAAMSEGERIASMIPEMPQPLVCAHDATGRPHLYLSPRFTLRIDSLPETTSTAVLENLFGLMQEPRFVYRHSWHEKDVVIWDNRRLNHRVLSYPADAIRRRHRVTILGRPLRASIIEERPTGCFQSRT